MSQANETTIKTAQIDTTKARPGQVATSTASASTKDAGRVHIGGGMMRF